MNQNWKNFLLDQNALFKSESDITFKEHCHDNANNNKIYPIAHLAVLKIGGADAVKLLQGQVTCNVNEVTETKSSLGALCTPKGRAITTFLLIKTPDYFLMVLPRELLEIVQKRLQMYVLRSAVTLTNCSDQLCLIGLSESGRQTECLFDTRQINGNDIRINFSKTEARHLIITEPDQAIKLWSVAINEQNFIATNSEQWRYKDLLSGLPWLTTETTEEFIPQMLNLDQLGGISYNKGCYTGQEIVARTHYLGKTKRELFLAECNSDTLPNPNSPILDKNAETEQVLAKVLIALPSTSMMKENQNNITMLIVLQSSEDNQYNLTLNDANKTPVYLLAHSL